MTRMILRRWGVRPGSLEPPCRAPVPAVVCFMFEYGNRNSQSIKYIFEYQSSARVRAQRALAARQGIALAASGLVP